MIQITPQMKILLAVEPVDFRKGIDGLAHICKTVIKSDPFSGYLFVFLNRGRTSMKIISYDPKSRNEPVKQLDVHELQLLIWNGNPMQSTVAPKWRELPN